MSSPLRRALGLGLFVLLITAGILYYTIDASTWGAIQQIRFPSLLLALGMFLLGMLWDGLRLQRLVRLAQHPLSLKAVFRVIGSNYFMALLTPGATGGAVAQVVLLRRYGIPAALGTPIVLVRTLFSILFLCTCLPLVFWIDSFDISYVRADVLLIGSALLFLAVFGGVWILRQRWVRQGILYWEQKRGHTGRARLQQLQSLNAGFALVARHPRQALLVFMESGLSLLFLYSIAPALMYAFTDQVPWLFVLGRMIVLNLVLYFAPTPGGAGVAEGLFIVLMTPFVPTGTVGIVAVAWRILAEYLPFLLGGYAMLTTFGCSLSSFSLSREVTHD